ncbi:MAG: hypothetical protein IVW54_01000 [Candidatus Binataceae bacterium]|nr:hypothetical protein [Candidatus Binataceae bacterium]
MQGPLPYLPTLVQALGQHYEFVSSPPATHLLPSDTQKGAEFKHGRFVTEDHRQIVIDQLTVYIDGVFVDVSTSTDDAELILADLQNWVGDQSVGIEFLPQKYYLSQLELEITGGLGKFAPAFQDAANQVTKALKTYGIEPPSYSVTGIFLNFDLTRHIGIQPGLFQLDRRTGVPFDQNTWFSQAPLKTSDHLELLNQLDKLKKI